MKKQSFWLVLLFLICISIPLTATAQIVDIPDPNLRAVIEDELGKALGATITVADMAHLTELIAPNANISDLTGLEVATNLTLLDLGGEYVDEQLINSNAISDLSPLAQLTNLAGLRLWNNAISDISAIVGLTNLEVLDLGNNFITDISPLVANTGLGGGDSVDVRSNFLNALSINTHIPTLQRRGVEVDFDTVVMRPEDIAQVVHTPDPELSAVIADARGKMPSASITMADMLTLTRLSAFDANISNLTGLEHAINLTHLFLRNGAISDLSPLAGLANLRQLWFENNSISDISALAGLVNLTYLGLGDNNISDISTIAGLTNLTYLGIFNNSISDISPIAGLTLLTELVIYNNPISDISALAGLINLTYLGSYNNAISDITPLAGLTNLTRLWLTVNSISDISAIAGLTNFTELWLFGNSISDLSPLVENTGLGNGDYVNVTENFLNALSINTHIPALQRRGVTVEFDNIVVRPEDIAQTVDIPDSNLHAAITAARGNMSSDPITLADMVVLTELVARNVNISDLTGLEHATNLINLDLGAAYVEAEDRYINSNSVSDLSPLSKLTTLTHLSFENNSVSDISALAGLTNLTQLAINGNSVSDISTLAGLTNLTRLWIDDNSISDISALAGLTNLTQLASNGNFISDISTLAGLTNLKGLWLWYNSISDISALAGLTSLTQLGLFGNAISDLSPLVENTGLANGDKVDVRENLLNAQSINTHIPALQSRGVTVDFDNIVVRPEDIAQTVDIPDSNLRAAIADARGKMPSDPITMADMLVLTQLDGRNANISDLTGLELATNLMRLFLNEEDVEAEGPYINSNSVSNLSPLAGLTNLTLLWLNDNSISDISPLAGLTNLTHLGLHSNSISDISPLADLTNLILLDLEDNSISDISPLVGLINLEHLDLWDNSISDISPLTGLTNLTELDLWDNSLSDISPLTGLTQLTYLDLGDNSISDLSPLAENTGLGSGDFVDVTGNPLSAPSINTHIPTLQSRGVEVDYDDTVAQPADVNRDGVINIFDLVSVASQLGKQGQNLPIDVNRDGIVDVRDLVLVAGMFGNVAAAPAAHPQAAELLTAAAVRQWITDAKALQIRDSIMERGIVILQQLLASLTPTETQLLANYPNPFNPETWIPYRLAQDAFVTLTIYDLKGQAIRTIDLGHQTAAAYESRSQAIYWDGRNQIGEKVASGVYFYHLSAGDYSATRKMLILK